MAYIVMQKRLAGGYRSSQQIDVCIPELCSWPPRCEFSMLSGPRYKVCLWEQLVPPYIPGCLLKISELDCIINRRIQDVLFCHLGENMVCLFCRYDLTSREWLPLNHSVNSVVVRYGHSLALHKVNYFNSLPSKKSNSCCSFMPLNSSSALVLIGINFGVVEVIGNWSWNYFNLWYYTGIL